MYVTKNITIDLNRPRTNMVHLGQGDNTRQILLTLLKDGLPYDVTDDAGTATLSMYVKYIKANGVTGSYDWTSLDTAAVVSTATDNVWLVNIDEHATDVPGFAQIFVCFSLPDGATLHSFPITLEVGDISSGETDPGEGYYANSSFVLVAQQAAKTSAMTQRVGIDAIGRLWVPPGGGGGGSGIEKITATITLSGTTYSSDTTYSELSDAISDGNIIEADTPDGLAHYDGLDGTNHIFTVHAEIGDAMRVVRYYITTADAISRIQFNVDNDLIPHTTIITVSDSTYSVAPFANSQYVFSNPMISLEITSGYATSGDWSIEFDSPTNVAPSVTLPSALKTIPASPTFSANHHYEINCHNGHAVVAEW